MQHTFVHAISFVPDALPNLAPILYLNEMSVPNVPHFSEGYFL